MRFIQSPSIGYRAGTGRLFWSDWWEGAEKTSPGASERKKSLPVPNESSSLPFTPGVQQKIRDMLSLLKGGEEAV
jgi:hypothetical protein